MQIQQFKQVTDDLVQAFARLMPQLSPDTKPLTAQELQEIIDAPGNVLLTARTAENAPITGVLTLAAYRTPTGMHAWIEDVIVEEAYRRKGIGEALTLAAIQHARAMGAKSVNLTSRPAREAANRLYQRLGFTRWETNLYRFLLK